MATKLFDGQLTTATSTGLAFDRGYHQVQAWVAGSGAVTATIIIEACLTPTAVSPVWSTIYTISLSGTTSDSIINTLRLAGGGAQIRARLTAISGTSAAVTVEVI